MSGPTPGPWLTCFLTGFVRTADNKAVAIPYGENGSCAGDDTAFANAALIAEAGTVATETGLSPRQLADQRAELLEALRGAEALVSCFMAVDGYSRKELEEMGRATAPGLRAVIAKVTGGAA